MFPAGRTPEGSREPDFMGAVAGEAARPHEPSWVSQTREQRDKSWGITEGVKGLQWMSLSQGVLPGEGHPAKVMP